MVLSDTLLQLSDLLKEALTVRYQFRSVCPSLTQIKNAVCSFHHVCLTCQRT